MKMYYLVVLSEEELIKTIFGIRECIGHACDLYKVIVERCVYDNKHIKEFEGLPMDDPKWNNFKLKFAYTDPKCVKVLEILGETIIDVTPKNPDVKFLIEQPGF